ncbi:MAG: hypothetical protein R3185_00020 [Candidatus Thermoplasmatota archaeon]|nr:hypothetical protein [Candidatus Thermoplasmatota archaeon]
MTDAASWTPYALEDVRVQLLWKKRILLAVILGLVFLIWALSLSVSTETEEQLTVYGGDGSSVTVRRPEETQVEPAAQVLLRPGETARLNEDLTLSDGETQPGERGAQLPPEPEGIPFLGLLLFLGPFLLAIAIWRYLGNQGTSTEVNYGIYKGAMPLEMITSSHSHMVLTGRKVEHNPFGKERSDYMREATADPADPRDPYARGY